MVLGDSKVDGKSDGVQEASDEAQSCACDVKSKGGASHIIKLATVVVIAFHVEEILQHCVGQAERANSHIKEVEDHGDYDCLVGLYLRVDATGDLRHHVDDWVDQMPWKYHQHHHVRVEHVVEMCEHYHKPTE